MLFKLEFYIIKKCLIYKSNFIFHLLSHYIFFKLNQIILKFLKIYLLNCLNFIIHGSIYYKIKLVFANWNQYLFLLPDDYVFHKKE